MKTCEERIDDQLESTMEDLQELWTAYIDGDDPDGYHPELGHIYEYGLGFDYVAPGTFEGQDEGYFRYQLSWGGPSSEFRIYADQQGQWRWSAYRIEFWFLDWFDGASRRLRGAHLNLLEEIFESMFVDTGTVDNEYEKALEGG